MTAGARHRWIPIRVDGVDVDPAVVSVVGIEALRQLARCERCGVWRGRRSGEFAEYGHASRVRGRASWAWTPIPGARLPRSKNGHPRTPPCVHVEGDA